MKFQRLAAVVLCLAAQPALSDSAAEIADLSARIDYGFYAEDERVVEAARTALARLDENDASVRYFRALGALRLAQLRLGSSGQIGGLLDECVEQATPEDERGQAAAESWIIVAACASLAARSEPLRSSVHRRRVTQALERARQTDSANPRIALVEAWSSSARSTNEQEGASEQLAAQLTGAVEAFRSWTDDYDAPQWGEAEALALLGELRLQRGESREARDLIERALLIAPDYRYALELRGVLLGSQGTGARDR